MREKLLQVFCLLEFSENDSRGFPGNRLTVAVILERGNTVCSSVTSHI